MKQFPLIVSYYTKETVYQLEVQNLLASCDKWNLRHCVESIPSFGSWERNCAYKPMFLLQKLHQFREPIFWVDADAVFFKKPEILPTVFQADIALRINAEYPDDHPSKIMSGSLYVNATLEAERVLKSWAKECLEQLSDPQRTEELWDQIVLRDVLKKNIAEAKIDSLPLAYTRIMGHPLDEKTGVEPVIAHYQASRRFKKIINELLC
jgi:hypothetical protein